jgi:hypothetical protein
MLSSAAIRFVRVVLLLDLVVSAALYAARFACCSSVLLEVVDMHFRTSLFDLYLMHLCRVVLLFIVYRDMDGFALQLADPHSATRGAYLFMNVVSLGAPFACAVWTVVRLLLMGSAFADSTVPSRQLTDESRALTFSFLALQLVFCTVEAFLRRLVAAGQKQWLFQSGGDAASNSRASAAAAAKMSDDKLDELLGQLDTLIATARVSGKALDKAAAQRLATAVQLEARAAASTLAGDEADKLLAAARALVQATLQLESVADLSAKISSVRALAPKSTAALSSEDEGLQRAPRRREAVTSDDERVGLLNKP